MSLSERKLKILSAIIDNYVISGEPIGSKLLAQVLDFPVSSATIRNEMAELSSLGYLEQPYTSAGRVPSPQGYRLYIKEIMIPENISDKEQCYIYGNLNLNTRNPKEILTRALELLSSETNLVAFSTDPQDYEAFITKIRIFQIDNKLGVLVVMTSTNQVVTENFRTDYELNTDLLKIFDRVFNQMFRNISMKSIDADFIRRVSLAMGEISILVSPILNALIRATKKGLKAEIQLEGQTNLLFIPGFDLASARQILDFISRKDELIKLISLDDKDKKIMVGDEIGRPELADSGMVVSKYYSNKNQSGVIGVIGPTRMNYAKVTAHIDCMRELIEKIFSDI